MSSLTGSSISGTYDQLLALPSGGGNDSTLVPITDGNGGTTFALQISSAGVHSTGTMSAASWTGILDITDTTDASTNDGDSGALRCEGGASIAKKLYVGTNLDVIGTSQYDGTLTVGVDNTGHDVKFFGDTASNYMLWDESADELIIQTTSGGLTLSSTAGADSSARPQLLIDGNTGGGSPGLAAAIQLNSVTNVRGKGIIYTSTDDNQHWFSGIPYNTNDP